MTEINQHSPYRHGADQGFILGIYLSVMFLCSVIGFSSSILNILFLVMFFGVPFILYRWMRHSFIEARGTLTLSALWLQGIVTFMCGMMISAVVALAYFRFFDPDFIIDRLNDVIRIYNSSSIPELQEMAGILSNMIEYKVVPSIGSIVMEVLWLGVFSGSILSLIVGAIVRSRKVVPVRE